MIVYNLKKYILASVTQISIYNQNIFPSSACFPETKYYAKINSKLTLERKNSSILHLSPISGNIRRIIESPRPFTISNVTKKPRKILLYLSRDQPTDSQKQGHQEDQGCVHFGHG